VQPITAKSVAVTALVIGAAFWCWMVPKKGKQDSSTVSDADVEHVKRRRRSAEDDAAVEREFEKLKEKVS
jgi:hypothetical protein